MGILEAVIEISAEHEKNVFGEFDVYAKKIERTLHVTLIAREGKVKILGEAAYVEKAKNVLSQLKELSKRGNVISEQNVDYALSLAFEGNEDGLLEVDRDIICHTLQGKPIKPKTLGQKKYVDAIRKQMITFGLGDLQSKIDPYLRPLYDALYQIMGAEAFLKNSEKGLIEVAPLAYMRGRTLDNAFIILDEAQNTTPAQMKMFLTRIGFGSKVVVTGDSTQKDLPAGSTSGLDIACKVLKNIDDISICHLTSKDVVRHPLVQKIVKAYEEYEKKPEKKTGVRERRKK